VFVVVVVVVVLFLYRLSLETFGYTLVRMYFAFLHALYMSHPLILPRIVIIIPCEEHNLSWMPKK